MTKIKFKNKFKIKFKIKFNKIEIILYLSETSIQNKNRNDGPNSTKRSN